MRQPKKGALLTVTGFYRPRGWISVGDHYNVKPAKVVFGERAHRIYKSVFFLFKSLVHFLVQGEM
jgi:hypothetical protein